MNSESEDPLESAARAITDGRSIDWDGLTRDHPDLASRLETLRMLQSLADSFQQPPMTAAPSGEAFVRSDPDPPFRWGTLEVLEKIGEGSFGQVYRAFDPMLQREVALKLRRMRGEAALTAFNLHLEEARRMARVRHPNVLAIHGVEVHGERAGLWTDFLHGKTLEARLSGEGPLPAAEVAETGIELCHALTVVHEAGLVHADIKASNVMREDDGRVILMDFGAGTSLDPQSPSLTGTPLVMAPELLEGGNPTPASDLYAVGVLLYRLACGRHPVRAVTREDLIAAHRSRARIPLPDLRPDFPPAIVSAIDRALEADPGARYSTAAEMAADLQASLLRDADFPSRASKLASTRGSERPNNLHRPATRFIGRERELAELRSLVWDSRLVALTGPGGTGKTRLAEQLAADLLEGFAAGAFWVELAALASEDQMIEETARVVQARSGPHQSVHDALAACLRGRSLLLVLDNCEHLIEECRGFVAWLLENAPSVRVLVTSRSPLRLDEERVYAVLPLRLPALLGEADGPASLEIADSEAVRLFLDRAVRARPTFALTRANAPAVARICRKLEGIPLAIELAAARLKIMTAEDIDARLDRSFGLLTGSGSEGPEHHRTLETLIAWSHRLLDPAEQALLRRLAVFPGRFGLEAAEAICGNGTDGEPNAGSAEIEGTPVVDLLTNLVDKSLLVFEAPEEEAELKNADPGPSTPWRTGYHMLEMIRQYAARELAISEEESTYRDRHLDHFLRFAEEAHRNLSGPEQDQWLLRVERDHDNLREALRWAASPHGDANKGARVANAIRRLWLVRGHAVEGLAHYRVLLARPDLDESIRGRVLVSAASLAWQRGEPETVRRYCREAIERLRRAGDEKGLSAGLSMLAAVESDLGNTDVAIGVYEEALALRRHMGPDAGQISILTNLGVAHARRKDLPTAARCYAEALAVCREFGDRPTEGACLSNLATAARDQGNLIQALAWAEEAVAILRASENEINLGGALGALGTIRLALGEPEAARALFRENLQIRKETREPITILHALDEWVLLLVTEQRMEEAARLQGAVERHREHLRAPIQPLERDAHERSLERTRAALGEERFVSLFAAGRGMSLDEAVGFALGGDPVR